MIEQKYQFFIDIKPQKNFLYKKTLAKNVHPADWYLLEGKKIDGLMSTITEYELNSRNDFLKIFCQDNNIENNIYYKIIRKFEKIKIVTWEIKNINELPEDTILFKQLEGFYSPYFEKINQENIPYIVKVDETFHIDFLKFVNYKKNIIISNNIFDNSKKLGLKYRIYLNNRLLIERFFPEDLPLNKIICEECFLNLDKPTNLKIVTNHDLIFTKIVSNNNVVYPNSKEFILEP